MWSSHREPARQSLQACPLWEKIDKAVRWSEKGSVALGSSMRRARRLSFDHHWYLIGA